MQLRIATLIEQKPKQRKTKLSVCDINLMPNKHQLISNKHQLLLNKHQILINKNQLMGSRKSQIQQNSELITNSKDRQLKVNVKNIAHDVLRRKMSDIDLRDALLPAVSKQYQQRKSQQIQKQVHSQQSARANESALIKVAKSSASIPIFNFDIQQVQRYKSINAKDLKDKVLKGKGIKEIKKLQNTLPPIIKQIIVSETQRINSQQQIEQKQLQDELQRKSSNRQRKKQLTIQRKKQLTIQKKNQLTIQIDPQNHRNLQPIFPLNVRGPVESLNGRGSGEKLISLKNRYKYQKIQKLQKQQQQKSIQKKKANGQGEQNKVSCKQEVQRQNASNSTISKVQKRKKFYINNLLLQNPQKVQTVTKRNYILQILQKREKQRSYMPRKLSYCKQQYWSQASNQLKLHSRKCLQAQPNQLLLKKLVMKPIIQQSKIDKILLLQHKKQIHQDRLAKRVGKEKIIGWDTQSRQEEDIEFQHFYSNPIF